MISNNKNRTNQYQSGENSEYIQSLSRSHYSVSLILGMLICGFVFGFAMQKGQVFVPEVIYNQMKFTDFTMLKMFLSAFASSLTIQSLYSYFNADAFEESRASYKYKMGYVKVLFGASVLGVGIAMGGSCPGNVFVQLGSGVPNSAYTLIGMIVAAMSMLVFETYSSSSTHEVFIKDENNELVQNNLDKLLSINYYSIALPMAIVVFSLVSVLEEYIPWYIQNGDRYNFDYKYYDSIAFTSLSLAELESLLRSIIVTISWNPIYSGMIVGSLQLPVRWLTDDGLGSASCNMTVVGSMCSCVGVKTRNTLDPSSILQLVYIYGGTVAGAYCASELSGEYNNATLVPGFNQLQNFVAGLLMMAGARIARGCTSGHGISGASELGLESFLAIIGMFGSGMMFAYVF